ncbi:MAG TPA: mannitol dehydrogenase family protein [Albitalea sp.]|uniref:mannitol dehydrogenase family protein n=1 Tax=Piscinibacter sp. TaxID=1903157 RepID=UPI002ED686D9
MAQPILQFGTGRFLQAHVDLFVSQALACGQALGGIAVVQSTASRQSSARLAALALGGGYPVEIRGLHRGEAMAEYVHVDVVREAWQAVRDWQHLLDALATDVQVIVSNTAESGYDLDEADGPQLLSADAGAPESFPAKLLVLLQHRWRRQPQAPLSIYPCELVSRNGDVLRERVLALGQAWGAPVALLGWIREHCVWLNSLVDRIVAEPLYPVGAVTEPYALWAIERQERMVLPCRHPAIVLTDDLAPFERLKLMLLNLGHTYLAERWLVDARDPAETVRDAMVDVQLRSDLEAVWRDEVLPVFDALGEGARARDYLDGLRDRLLNPFLQHRLADIARDHALKKVRRIAPVVALAREHRLGLPQPRLGAALASHAGGL